MKSILKALFIALLAVVTVCGGCGVLFLMTGGLRTIERQRLHKRLIDNADHRELALAAASVSLRTEELTIYRANDLTNLPPAIADMNPTYVTVSPKHLRIELHGGFAHFGFFIEKQTASWNLSWYTERRYTHILSVTNVIETSPSDDIMTIIENGEQSPY